jgi:mannose-6-phosphate isomerase-like protein (cupin superfamily)
MPATRLAAISGRWDRLRTMMLGPTPNTGPDQLVLHHIEPPDGPVEEIHVHDSSDEVVRVIEGIVYLTLEDEEQVLTPGDEATIPAGARHRRWNAGDEHAHLVEIHRPALRAQRSAERLAA